MTADPDRPSGRAVDRLATGVGDEVSGLRNQLRRALDEADRLQAAGRGDLAVTVLEEQRDALVAVHRQLEARLADAVVEREAEGVLAEAASRAPLREVGPGPRAPAEARDPVASGPVASDDVPAPVGEDHMGLRLVAAAAAAVLGVTLLLTPELGPGSLSAAGSTTASGDDAPGDAPHGAEDGTAPTESHPMAGPERDHGQQHVRDVWALALRPDSAPATSDEGHDDDGADLADVVELLPLPRAAVPLDPVTADPTRLVVDDDTTDGDGGPAASDTDGGASTDTTGDDGEGTSGPRTDGTEGTESTNGTEGTPEGGGASGDGTGGTGPSGGATTTAGDSDGSAPDDGGSVDLESGAVTPGVER